MMAPIVVPVWIDIAEWIRQEILLHPSGSNPDIQTYLEQVHPMPPETRLMEISRIVQYCRIKSVWKRDRATVRVNCFNGTQSEAV